MEEVEVCRLVDVLHLWMAIRPRVGSLEAGEDAVALRMRIIRMRRQKVKVERAR